MTDAHQKRRLATILAADVFGYSRLMAKNEEETLRTLKAYRGVIDGLIARHEGRIFNTAGDSVLAEFGSAVEAVRCAITIQEELRVRNSQIDENRRMELRIGINVGDVLVEGDNLYGDGVNIAARLEGIATPGNICISGSVYSLVKNKLSYGFEDIGLQTVKNIPEPVPAFRLTSSVSVPHAEPSRRRLIAAGAVLAILLAVGGGAWALRVFQSSSTNLTRVAKTETDVPSGHARAPVSHTGPSDAGNTFDGVWEFKVTGGEYCPIKSKIFIRTIRDGAIIGPNGRKDGQISKDGSFQFWDPAVADPKVIVQSQGTINGETGRGGYVGLGTLCKGTYEIRFVEKL